MGNNSAKLAISIAYEIIIIYLYIYKRGNRQTVRILTSISCVKRFYFL